MRLAFVLVLGAACGDGRPAPDAPPSDASTGGLVRVQYHSQLAGNQRVLFQAADSSIVLATITDDDGRANAYMPDGSFVTLVVALGGGFGFDRYTWVGVKAAMTSSTRTGARSSRIPLSSCPFPRTQRHAITSSTRAATRAT